MRLIHLLPVFLVTNSIFAEPSTESLNQFQKQTVKTIEASQQVQRDFNGLDLFLGKLGSRQWILKKYPSGQELGAGAKPRLEMRNSRAAGVTAFVPTRHIRGKFLPGSSVCSATSEYQVDLSACSEVNEILSCVAGKVPILGSACTPSGQQGPSDFTVDNSQMGSLEVLSQDSLEQTGFIGVPDLKLVEGTTADQLFSKNTAVLSSNAIAAVPFKVIKHRTHTTYPLLVTGLEVQVGSTLAVVPLQSPDPATCEVVPSTASANSGQTVTFTMNGTSVISNAHFNGSAIALPSQSSDPGTRVLSAVALTAPNQFSNATEDPSNPDYAFGDWSVSGRVEGPVTDGGYNCQGRVRVRFYRPRPPICTVTVSPVSQEPDLPVAVTVKVKNQVNSITLNGRSLSVSPTPSVFQEGTGSVQLNKSGDSDEVLVVNLSGPGGAGTCQTELRFLRPQPPQCNLTASPSNVSACNPNTTLTLDCVNRVHTASINGTPVTLNQGKASISYRKSGLVDVSVAAQATNRWWATPSTPHVTIGDQTVAPTCTLTASTTNIMVGENTTLTLSNVQGCYDAGQIDIAGNRVALDGSGRATLTYTKQNANAETLVAHVRGPEGLVGTCQVAITGYPIPAPTCSLTASKTTLEKGEQTQLSLTGSGKISDGEFYIQGRRGATYTFTKNSCASDLVTGYVVGPGGRSADCSVEIRHQTPRPSCQLVASPGTGLLSGDSATATLSCQNGRYLKEARLYDELKTTELQNNGSASRVLANLPVGTTPVRALAYDVCDNQILDQTVQLQVGVRPPPCPYMRENEWVKLGIQTGFDYCTENNAAGTGWLNCKTKYNFGNLLWGISEKTYSPNNNTAQYKVGRWPHVWNSAIPNPDEAINKNNAPLKDINCKKSENRLCMRQADVNLVKDYSYFLSIKDTHLASCKVSDLIARDAGGCFTGQTPILMANGQEKLISEIRENDYVLNPHYGMGVRVRKVVKGPEKKPLYAVMLGQKKIEVTEDHPFFTQRGWVQTLDLKLGDRLFGKGQGQVITKVMRLPYQQPVDVWNFELDTEDPLAHVVVANGIPTGDLVTQLELKKNKKPLP